MPATFAATTQAQGPASYYKGATNPSDAKRHKTDCWSATQDPVDSKSDMATQIWSHHLSVVEHDAHTSETNSSSSHTYVSQHSAIELLTAMGFNLPKA